MLDADNLIIPLVLLFILSIVLIGFIIFLIISNRKLMQNTTASINDNYNKYKNELKEQNNVLTKQLLKQIDDKFASVEKQNGSNKNLMNIFNKLKEATKESCFDTMNQIGAARIAIYLFHNGTHSTHGINFIKLSCIGEKVAIGSGVREQMIKHTNLPINLFDDMVEKLINHNRFIIMNNEETKESNHKMFISADKINYTQLVTIYDIDNNMLGFVAAEMDRSYSKDEADKEKEILDELVKQLVPVLSYSDYALIQQL